MKKTFKTKWLAMFLSLLMVTSLVPMSVYAEDNDDHSVRNIDITNVTFDYKAGMSPVATAKIANSDAHYEIEYECWSEMREIDETTSCSAAYWYSNPSYMQFLKEDEKLYNFKDKIQYYYSIQFRAKDGYTFPSENEISVTINGEKISSEYYNIYDSNVFGVIDIKDIRLAQISKVEIGGTTLSYQVGDTPKATSFKNCDNYYDYNIEYEYWEEMQSKDDGSVVPVAYWYSDEEMNSALPDDKKITKFEEGKTYMYSIALKTNNGRTFAGSSNFTFVFDGNVIKPENYTIGEDNTTLFAFALKTIKPVKIKYIDKIEISNAKLSFNVGDKPVFTGEVPSDAPYYIDHEGWLTEKGGITSSEYWNGRYGDFEGSWGKLITSFEANTKYSYNVYVKLTDEGYNSGYRFNENTNIVVNGVTYKFNNETTSLDPNGETIWYYSLLDMTPNNDNPCINGHTKVRTVTKATISKNGKIVTTCSVCKKTLSTAIIPKIASVKLSNSTFTYNGKTIKPSVIVKDSKGKKINNSNYTVAYSKGLKNVGNYKVTIKFKGNYSGTVNKTFTIVPKSTTLTNLSSSKKKVTVKWKKQVSQTNGYQLQYSLNSNFKSAKVLNVTNNKATSKSISNLKSKKKYYVRIRTYKNVKVNGKSTKLYSTWSKSLNVKVK